MPVLSISDILTFPVTTLSSDSTIKEVLSTMHDKRISAIVVIQEDYPIGIFTERDALMLAYNHKDVDDLSVGEIINKPLVSVLPHIDFREAYHILLEHNLRHLVVVDEYGKLAGIVSESDFIKYLDKSLMIQYKEVGSLMEHHVLTLTQDDTVEDAIALMGREHGSYVLIEKNNQAIGIFTERDLVRLESKEKYKISPSLKDVMTRPVSTVPETTSLPEALKIMQNKRIRRLVVVDKDEQILGVVAYHDVVKKLYSPHIEHLMKKLEDKDEELQVMESKLNKEREFRRVQKHLLESQRLAHIGSWELDLSTNHLWWSEETFNIFELDSTKFDESYESFLSLVHPDDKDLISKTYKESIANHTPYEIVHRLYFEDGRTKYLHEYCETFYDDLGKPIRSVGTVQDISKQKQMEDRYRLMFEKTGTCMAIVEEDGTFSMVNQRFAELAESTIEALEGSSFSLLVDAADREKIESYHMGRLNGEDTLDHYEFAFLSTKGKRGTAILYAILLEESRQTIVSIIDISDRKKAEDALQESYDLLTTIINTAPLSIFWKDRDLNYIGCNTTFAKDAGKIDPREIIGKNDYALSWKDQAELYSADDRHVINSNIPKLSFEEPQTTPDGKTIWLRTSKVPLLNDKKETIGILGMYEDITEFREKELHLRQSETVFENISEGIVITDNKQRILAVNPAFSDITRYTQEDVLGKKLDILHSDRHNSDFYKQIWDSLLEIGTWQGEILSRRKNGEIFPELLSISSIKGQDNSVVNYVAVFSDISKIKKTEEDLLFLSHHDPLTQLPNRFSLNQRLEHLLERQARKKSTTAILFLDLDRFKEINDNFGHPYGDLLLQEIAKRLKNILQEEDTLARVGGDEFVILIEDIKVSNEVALVAQKILNELSSPITIQEHEVTMTGSIGIAVSPIDGIDVTTLLKNADIALYRAKDQGRNSFEFFSKDMAASNFELLYLHNALRNALVKEEFIVYYQPQVNIETGKVLGTEALVRWNSPEMGLISPIRFIPIAEDTGLIVPLGKWILREACLQMKKWIDNGSSLQYVAVNVAARQLSHSDFVETVKEALIFSQLDASNLELEITESTIMKEENYIGLLNELKALGIRLSIDDFGTGYSSLLRLKHMPIDKLKIDQSFVSGVPDNQDDLIIIEAVIGLAKSLKMDVIAEGVEREEQVKFLLEKGCKKVQGYLYSRPIPALELEQWLLRL